MPVLRRDGCRVAILRLLVALAHTSASHLFYMSVAKSLQHDNQGALVWMVPRQHNLKLARIGKYYPLSFIPVEFCGVNINAGLL